MFWWFYTLFMAIVPTIIGIIYGLSILIIVGIASTGSNLWLLNVLRTRLKDHSKQEKTKEKKYNPSSRK